MVVADVSVGQLIWTTFFLFMLAAFVWLFVVVARDLFRTRELSGWAKAGWLVGLIVFPLIGPLAYILVRGLTVGSAEDAAARAQLSRTEYERYARGVTNSTGTSPDGPT